MKATLDYNKSKSDCFAVAIAAHCSGIDFRAEAENKDSFKAIDECCHKIETQLKKDREKKTEHHKAKQKSYSKRSKSNLYKKAQNGESKVELESHKFFADTMNSDQAIDSLEQNNLKYFVYRDSDSGKVNTVIKIDEQLYKFIEV